jgi:hypothetical protein
MDASIVRRAQCSGGDSCFNAALRLDAIRKSE